MSLQHPTQLPGDKLKNAITAFSELVQQHPDKKRNTLLNQVEIKFDLSPRECQFLHDHFSDKDNS